MIRRDLRVYGMRLIVNVYPDLQAMRRAARRFNSNDHHDSLACTQAYDVDGGDTIPVIRFAAGHITTEILVHEASHAATALYANRIALDPALDISETLAEHLNHWNEPLAHLHSRTVVTISRSLRRAGVAVLTECMDRG